jgi:hypothetical protein
MNFHMVQQQVGILIYRLLRTEQHQHSQPQITSCTMQALSQELSVLPCWAQHHLAQLS